jgi:hypothetical protein
VFCVKCLKVLIQSNKFCFILLFSVFVGLTLDLKIKLRQSMKKSEFCYVLNRFIIKIYFKNRFIIKNQTDCYP